MKQLREMAETLDREDGLAAFRERFHIPRHHDGSELAYLCGHSLGLQAKSVQSVLGEDLEAWRDRAVRGHFEGPLPWLEYNDRLRQPLADLLGAQAAEVVIMNTLTVNLHLMMVSFFRPRGRRRKILIEQHAFPSDRYAVTSQLRYHGLDPQDCLVELAPKDGSHLIDEVEIESFLRSEGDEIALVLWPGVQYVSGQAFDLARIAAAGREAGAMVGFDLAHAAGNVPLALHDSGGDFAAWCHYKYLNAGPGAVGGCFIHQRHHDRADLPRFHGWWGNDPKSRFMMDHGFDAAAGADAWQLSTPPTLAIAPLRASLELFGDAGMVNLRRKSLAMTGFLLEGIQEHLDETIEVITPLDPARRGSQLSLRLRAGRDRGRDLFEFLESRGVLTDWREPDVIRVAPAPLYNRFEDCWRFLKSVSDWRGAKDNPAYR